MRGLKNIFSLMSVNIGIFFIPIMVCSIICFTGCRPTRKTSSPNTKTLDDRGHFRVMFYNVENLFDTIDEPGKNDEEYLPEGSRYWTPYRFRQKLLTIYKVVAAAGEWDAPDVIGLCEVENRFVLELLRELTPLVNIPYNIIHRDSPDVRGIDVALMYRPDKMEIIDSAFFTLVFPHEPTIKTREILYAKGLLSNDTLHFFVNHWPSRLGGAQAELSRMFTGSFLRKRVDSLFKVNPRAKIIIMGDFNDEPNDRSLTEGLGALTTKADITEDLYNLMAPVKQNTSLGTHKYQGQWAILDQFIVSAALLQKNTGVFTTHNAAKIMMQDFLLIEDEIYSGQRPYRTYDGFRYAGGFSDHLPITLDLWINR